MGCLSAERWKSRVQIQQKKRFLRECVRLCHYLFTKSSDSLSLVPFPPGRLDIPALLNSRVPMWLDLSNNMVIGHGYVGRSSKNQTSVTGLFLLYLETVSVTGKTTSSAVPEWRQWHGSEPQPTHFGQRVWARNDLWGCLLAQDDLAPPDGTGYGCAFR